MSHLVVIGGTSGIGQEVVRQADDSGRFDAITATGPDELDVRMIALRIEDHLRVLDAEEPITHVVYSAGIASLQTIDDLEEFGRVFDVNVFGFLRVLRSLKLMNAGHRIVAVVSDASTTPMRGSISYCSSKAALAMAIRCAAREMAPAWSINGVSPSAVEDTPMTDWIDATVPGFRGWTPENARSYEMSGMPMGRRARKDEVAEVILSTLHGPEFVSGSIIPITGGKS